MDVYIVVGTGTNVGGVNGVFSSLEKAEKRLEVVAATWDLIVERDVIMGLTAAGHRGSLYIQVEEVQ